MSENIKGIFWGLVLIFIDVRLGEFDVLPDIVGAIIVVFSLYGLRDINDGLNMGWKSSVAYMLFVAIEIIIVLLGHENQVLPNFCVAVANLVMMVNLLYGLGMAVKDQNLSCQDIGESLNHASYIYCAVYIGVFVLSFIPVVNMLALIGSFIYYVRLLFLIFELRKYAV